MCQAGFHHYNKIPEIPPMREKVVLAQCWRWQHVTVGVCGGAKSFLSAPGSKKRREAVPSHSPLGGPTCSDLVSCSGASSYRSHYLLKVPLWGPSL